jgi:hypothetical protein
MPSVVRGNIRSLLYYADLRVASPGRMLPRIKMDQRRGELLVLDWISPSEGELPCPLIPKLTSDKAATPGF